MAVTAVSKAAMSYLANEMDPEKRKRSAQRH